MPTINIDLSNAKGFEELPLGEYLGEIEKIVYMPPREAGKFGQLRVQYTVIDGDSLGRKASEFLSLSPKATFRLVAWMKKFGGEWGDLDTEEVKELNWETDEEDTLVDPDLSGIQVIFKVFEEIDKRTHEMRTRTQLVSVEDEVDIAVEPAGATDDAADEAAPEPEAEAEEPVKAAAPAAPRPAARRPAVAAAAKPARRTLR